MPGDPDFSPLPNGMRRWDCSGADAADFQSRGLERQLAISIIGRLRTLKGCPTGAKLKPASWPEGYLRGTKGTPNHRAGTRIDYYIDAMMGGSPERRVDARDLVLDFFADQARNGHMAGELMTTSHYQIWSYQTLACRAVAQHYGDQAVIEATGQWLRRDYYLLDLVAVDSVPVSPGARPAGRSNPLRTAMYWLYNGYGSTPCPALPKGWGNPNEEKNGFWRNAYNVAAWIARELIRDGDDLGGTRRGEKERAVLRDPMYVYRRGDDYVIAIPHFTKSGPVVLPWVARIDGVETEAEEKRGRLRDWDSPPMPKLEGARLTVVSGAGRKAAQIQEDEDDDEAAET